MPRPFARAIAPGWWLPLALGCNLVADLGGYEVVAVAPADGGAAGASQEGGGGAAGGSAGMGGATPDCDGPCAGEHRFTHHFPGTNLQQVTALAADDENAVYAGGEFFSDIDIGGNVAMTVDSERDLFLLKLSEAGVLAWQLTNVDARDQHIAALTMDGDSLVGVGSFEESLTLGATTVYSGTNFNLHAFKLTKGGDLVWLRNWGGTGNVTGNDVAPYPGGGIVVGGDFGGALDLGGGPLAQLGGNDGFIAHFDSDGEHVWSQSIGGTGVDLVQRVAATPDGGFVVLGSCGAAFDAGGGPLPYVGGADIFLVKYNGFAVHQWSRAYGGPEADEAKGLAVDAEGRIFVAGAFRASIDFGAGLVTSAGESDAFILVLDAEGALVHRATFGDAAVQVATAVAEDTHGNLLVGGTFEGSLDLGGGVLVSGGADDVFVAKLSAEGFHHYSRRYGNPGLQDQVLLRLATDRQGNGIVAGHFEGAINFGGGPVNAVHQADGFLASLTP